MSERGEPNALTEPATVVELRICVLPTAIYRVPVRRVSDRQRILARVDTRNDDPPHREHEIQIHTIVKSCSVIQS